MLNETALLLSNLFLFNLIFYGVSVAFSEVLGARFVDTPARSIQWCCWVRAWCRIKMERTNVLPHRERRTVLSYGNRGPLLNGVCSHSSKKQRFYTTTAYRTVPLMFCCVGYSSVLSWFGCFTHHSCGCVKIPVQKVGARGPIFWLPRKNLIQQKVDGCSVFYVGGPRDVLTFGGRLFGDFKIWGREKDDLWDVYLTSKFSHLQDVPNCVQRAPRHRHPEDVLFQRPFIDVGTPFWHVLTVSLIRQFFRHQKDIRECVPLINIDNCS